MQQEVLIKSCRTIVLLAGIVWLAACSGPGEKKNVATPEAPAKVVNAPKASADSAFYFVKKQVDFGPRVPNSKAHRAAGDFLIETLKQYGATVTVQEFQMKNYSGENLSLRNIIASFYPEKTKRILLASHWDTRPFASKDKEKPNAPTDGANDGASGVGVLLELARTLKNNHAPEVGVDLIFFDGEDWGDESEVPAKLPEGQLDWWCLGSQYWAKHKHKPNYSAYYGILLDMVGAKGARFPREGFSQQYAPSVVEKVWNTAAQLGYGHIFVKQNEGGITDDHRFVSEVGKVPMIDIVNSDPVTGYFGDFHHTRKDNIDIIDKASLEAVGNVLLYVIYAEDK